MRSRPAALSLMVTGGLRGPVLGILCLSSEFGPCFAASAESARERFI